MASTKVKPLYLIIRNPSGYAEESNGDKYLILIITDGKKTR